MAVYKESGTNTWRVIYRYVDWMGERKQSSKRGFSTKREDIYGFNISHETVSEITDKVLEELNKRQNRPLKKFYTFLFVDCMYVTIRKDYEVKNYAVYAILG